MYPFNSVQSLSPVWLFVTPWTTARQASLVSPTSHHQLLEFTQTQVHGVSDAIQPSHPCHPLLLSPSIIPSLRVSSNESALSIRWQSIGVSASTSVLPMNIQDWLLLGWTGWIPFQVKRLSRVFSNTTVQKHHFFGAQISLKSNSHIHTWLLETP